LQRRNRFASMLTINPRKISTEAKSARHETCSPCGAEPFEGPDEIFFRLLEGIIAARRRRRADAQMRGGKLFELGTFTRSTQTTPARGSDIMFTRTHLILILSFFAVAAVAGWASAEPTPIAHAISISAR
jgi:hypothetical protein